MSDRITTSSKRELIFTADDFGLNESVNEAVELAHRKGVLGCASLMVTAGSLSDAIRRARRHPALAVGLHLVLSNGPALTDKEDIPQLVDDNGYLPENMVIAGLRYFISRKLRNQLAHEIRAQFRAFTATGLQLDHVNVHKHFHFHPTLLNLILCIGRDYGMRSIRLPDEPLIGCLTVCPGSAFRSRLQPSLLLPLTHWMRRKINHAHLFHNDYIIGLTASGKMSADLILELLPRLPVGIGEVYFHPSIEPNFFPVRETNATHPNSELAALLDPRIPLALNHWNIRQTTFHDAAR